MSVLVGVLVGMHACVVRGSEGGSMGDLPCSPDAPPHPFLLFHCL